MNTDKTSIANGSQSSRLGGVISRLIVYALIWIACYHICNVWLNDDGNMDLLWATMWTGNIAWIKPFWRWMTNGL